MNSSNKALSRGPSLDMDKCVENAGGNRFNLVLIASERSREIKRQHRESERREHIYSTITALEEVQASKIGIEYLAKISKRKEK